MLVFRVTKANYIFYEKIKISADVTEEEVFSDKWAKDNNPEGELKKVYKLFKEYIIQRKKKETYHPAFVFFARIYTNLYYNLIVMMAIFGKTSLIL